MTSTTDAVTVTTCVAVDPTTAFTVFTDEIDRWWRRGPRYRFVDGHGTLAFTEGRLVERGPAGSHEVGRVLQWEPGVRLSFECRAKSFAAGEFTIVEVSFAVEGEGTRVTVVNRGWDKLPAAHPAKAGYEGGAFTAMIGLWWGDLLLPLQRRLGAVA